MPDVDTFIKAIEEKEKRLSDFLTILYEYHSITLDEYHEACMNDHDGDALEAYEFCSAIETFIEAFKRYYYIK